MNYFRFGIRDLLWAMVVVSIGLLAWHERSRHVAAQEKLSELEKTVETLRLVVQVFAPSHSQPPVEPTASKVLGDLPLTDTEADGRPESPLEEFLRTDKGHLLIE